MSLGKRRRSPSIIDRLLNCCQKKLVREASVHIKDLSAIPGHSLLRHSVLSTNLDEHVKYFQHKRRDDEHTDSRPSDNRPKMNAPKAKLVNSIIDFNCRETTSGLQEVNLKKKTNEANNVNDPFASLDEVITLTGLKGQQNIDEVHKVHKNSLDESQNFSFGKNYTQSNQIQNSDKTIIIERDEQAQPNISPKGFVTSSVSANSKAFNKSSPAQDKAKSHHPSPRTPLDFDSYLALVEPRKFYLVRHLGRGLFVKFTETHLKLSNDLYAKGKKTNHPKDMHPSVTKYFPKRYTLFSRFDEGIKLDTVGWFSVTPEVVASYTAKRLSYPKVIDMFSGVGGNSIQFALHGSTVTAIEIDKERVEISKNNSRVYEVEQYINFICGDVLEIDQNKTDGSQRHNSGSEQKDLNVDVVFMSPPWGGTEYSEVGYYSLFTQISPNMREVLRKALQLSRRVCVHLPRNTVVSELVVLFSLLVQEHRNSNTNSLPLPPTLEVEKIYIGQNLKCIQVYFGDFKEVDDCLL